MTVSARKFGFYNGVANKAGGSIITPISQSMKSVVFGVAGRLHYCVLGILLVMGPAFAEGDYEVPPIFEARDILPAELLTSDHHRVVEMVENDGYLNHYLIQSDYGDFDVQGLTMLRIRTREVQALAELDKISKTNVFLKSAANAGVQKGKSIINVAIHPVATVKGIPSGLARLFRQGKDLTVGVYELGKGVVTSGDGEEGTSMSDTAAEVQDLAEDIAGLSSIERRWARDLRVDPYTTNETLRLAITSVARVEFAARTGFNVVVPGIPGTTYVSGVNDVVWTKNPYELRDMNRAALLEMGAPEELADAFFTAPWYTPSLETSLIAALGEMEGTRDRPVILEQALRARSEVDARYFVASTMLFAWFHREQQPVERFFTGVNMPVAITSEGRVVSILPVEYLTWTKGIAAAADRFTALAETIEGATGREFWFGGQASPRCLEELTRRGWTVHQQVNRLVDLPLDVSSN